MNKEEEFVVKPLERWFQRQKTPWELQKPKYATASTGWDLEARRKNLDLLIEAKYIDGPFISSFSRLVSAPLAYRRQKFMKTKYHSWCYYTCWAIGCGYESRNLFQLIFDYIVRNPTFWEHYAEDLKLKYVYFVKDGKVARVLFKNLTILANRYQELVGNKKRGERREIADQLMAKYKYS